MPHLCACVSVYVCCLFRMGILESGLKGARERVTQLQVEKEKALADLKNIHKINRTIEK